VEKINERQRKRRKEMERDGARTYNRTNTKYSINLLFTPHAKEIGTSFLVKRSYDTP